MIKNVIFDFGDTLVESVPSVASIFLFHLRKRGIKDVSIQDIEKVLEQSSRQFAFSELNGKSREVQYIQKNRYVLSAFSLGDDIRFAESIYDSCKSKIHWKLFEDVTLSLKLLSQDFFLYIFSNWGGSLKGMVVEFGISDYFDGVFSSLELKEEKPNLYFFKEMVSRIRAREEECLYIGNDYFLDIEPLRETKITPCLLDRENLYSKKTTPLIFGGLSDFTSALRRK
jgi:putative hydrolase of the HAD superfamily